MSSLRTQKGQSASLLLREIYTTNCPKKKQFFVELLNDLWPSIRCDFQGGGLKVWYLSERVKRLPRGLLRAAVYVEAVRPNGTAAVIKDTHKGPRILASASILATEFDSDHAHRTIWEMLVRDVHFA